MRQIPNKPPYCIHACLISETVFNDRNSMNVISIAIKPQLVLAVLNSRLVSYWFIHKLGKMQRGIFPQFKVNELAIFPVLRSFAPHEESLIASVKRILAAKEANPAAYAPEASAAQQRDWVTHLHQTFNAPSHPIANRLLRLTADSPDLLTIINPPLYKKEVRDALPLINQLETTLKA